LIYKCLQGCVEILKPLYLYQNLLYVILYLASLLNYLISLKLVFIWSVVRSLYSYHLISLKFYFFLQLLLLISSTDEVARISFFVVTFVNEFLFYFYYFYFAFSVSSNGTKSILFAAFSLLT
jgi:hypothetical protein